MLPRLQCKMSANAQAKEQVRACQAVSLFPDACASMADIRHKNALAKCKDRAEKK